MPSSVRFAKACPTCGRALQIPIELLGKDVCCHSCGAAFRATQSGSGGQTYPAKECIDQRVDRLIQEADRQLSQVPTVFTA
jgi:hypothetical protein